jgi:hypothetical protein
MKITNKAGKYIAISILFILLPLPFVFSQPDTISEISVGIRQGINFSKVNFDPVVSQKTMQGYTGGLVIKYMSQLHAGIQAEVNYSQRGWIEQLTAGKSYQRRINYIEVPILTHFEFGKKNSRAFLNVGPNLSFHNSNHETFSLTEADTIQKYYHRNLDNTFEFGLCAGLGFLQKTTFGDFQIEARIHYGLQNLFSSNIETNLLSSQNQLVAVTLTYMPFRKNFMKKPTPPK